CKRGKSCAVRRTREERTKLRRRSVWSRGGKERDAGSDRARLAACPEAVDVPIPGTRKVSARNRSSHCLVSGRSYHATIASLLSQCMGEKRRSSRFPRAPESHRRAHPGDQAQPGSADPKHGTGAGCWSPSMRLRKVFG